MSAAELPTRGESSALLTLEAERGRLRCAQPSPLGVVADQDRVVSRLHRERQFAFPDAGRARHQSTSIGGQPLRICYPTRRCYPRQGRLAMVGIVQPRSSVGCGEHAGSPL
jgi:hypothetical protein